MLFFSLPARARTAVLVLIAVPVLAITILSPDADSSSPAPAPAPSAEPAPATAPTPTSSPSGGRMGEVVDQQAEQLVVLGAGGERQTVPVFRPTDLFRCTVGTTYPACLDN
ncbi:hypothetical protein ACFY2W_36135 [Streptomyces sp. NPDC001262]|uniref:hypothetical protein n=1 Tax=Streptomyces sp. NPDC001262 TaxID=3364552 RepID=UPI0036B9EB15